MNLQELANLIAVRNHLSLLINTDRMVVPKDRIREVGNQVSTMDRLIVEKALELQLDQNEGAATEAHEVNGAVVIKPQDFESESVNADMTKGWLAKGLSSAQSEASQWPSHRQQVLDADKEFFIEPRESGEAQAEAKPIKNNVELEKTAKTSKKKAKAKSADDDAIRARIAQAKKEVASKKSPNKPSFKRADD